MRSPKFLLALTISTLALAACAQGVETVSSAAPPPTWAFEKSDVPVDPAFRFGKLPNGMRYVIRPNATPKGTAKVYFHIAAGSLDEQDSERGFAHFIEHMAFNGSKNVPEGEMVKLLERSGLSFGSDTNAETSYDHTIYKLDLPRNDAALLDTALMLMRETASELTISQGAVDREKGILLSELRDRNTFQQRNFLDRIEFELPGSRFAARHIIGTQESLQGASSAALTAFWRREYVPTQATLYVIGDFDPAIVEARIGERFASWQPAPAEPRPSAGPIPVKPRVASDIYTDPALSEGVLVMTTGPWKDEPDSLAQRKENVMRSIGYSIINRRLQRRSREPDAPFRSASFASGDLFRDGQETWLGIDTVDGQWRRGLVEAGKEYKRAMLHGFTPEEVAEQVANQRTARRNAAKGETTRSNDTLMGAAISLVKNDVVPVTPSSSAERFEEFAAEITPETVLAALKREALPLDKPLIRFQGRTAPADGDAGLRSAWAEAMAAPVAPPERKAATTFGYTDFGAAGKVISDTRDPALGIRMIRFENGVRLNLKKTDLKKDQVLVQISVDGGAMLNTRENPMAMNMAGMLGQGGLGKHSRDELDSILAGHAVSANFRPGERSLVAVAGTTPADLELQLQYLAAQITDPGYRPEAEVRFTQNVNNMFAALRSTPGSALGADLGSILSDKDPRFSLGNVEEWRKLNFAKLKGDLGDRLRNGAIEIAIVGDIDEDAALALVGRTFGALPAREPDFRPYAEQRVRSFTRDRKPRVLRHTGAKDQALLTLTWPTRDGQDPVADVRLGLLERVMGVVLTDNLREKLGKTYSPQVGQSTSQTYPGWGTFTLAVSVDVKEVPATRSAIAEALAELRDQPISDDLLKRAKAPMLEGYDNALKNNAGWLSIVDNAQTEPEWIERYVKGRERIMALSAKDVQAMARLYLTSIGGLEILVLPEGVDTPKGK
ncbi:insulinase family protein [Novosphingobium sp.]|uniref:M16 family metallopeptidase n=1 Tax=Novosphingobium sp. TaxID=1874826 RepID=UPI0025D6E62D|nr:insulinase family protein [Novosphingobium sp.]MCC6925357.1 insulinase family protein [Novosphingobium sp.]